MNCDEISSLLDALHDGELPLHEAKALEDHLAHCRQCSRELEQIKVLTTTLRKSARFQPPPSLAHAIISRIENRPPASQTDWRRWFKPVLTHMAAVLAGGIIVYSALQLTWDHGVSERQVVAAHVRSLMANNLTQVTTGNPHKVKPWFSGKLDFSPIFRDLAEKGFPLAGGRIDYLQERSVAVLVYRRRAHLINLFVMPVPDKPDTAPATTSHNGYNVVNWTRAHFAYWAVSDLNKHELMQFTELAAK